MGKMAKVPATIALESGKQNSFSKRVSKLKKKVKQEAKVAPIPANKDVSKAQRGLVYLSHIPHGFYEQQILTYFKQFGKVTNVRVLRSHNTGKSKGAAFVEFQEPEVAKIAAETMDNYLMFKRRIEAKFIEREEKHKNLFKISISPKKFVKQKHVSAARQAKNTNISESVHQKRIAMKLKKINKSGMLQCLQINDLDFDLVSKDLKGIQANNLEEEKIKVGKKEVKKGKSNTKADVKIKQEMVLPEPAIEKKKRKSLKVKEETNESDDPELIVAPDMIITARRSNRNKNKENIDGIKDKKSLKTIQKSKTLKKDKAVLNADVMGKIMTKSKSGRKAQLALNSDLVKQVDLVGKKTMGKVKKLGKK